MTPEQAAALRAPFPAEAIGKLPKLTCKACSNSPSRNCEKHSKSKCAVCGNWISSAHIDLDYVGHAGVRDRLLQVDPEWTWTPAATDPNTGAPLCTDGGLWIAMTVAGVTRLGWGDGPDIKQRISDAIRNAAMTFGVALDLWSKEDLHASDENAADGTPAAPPPGSGLSSPTSAATSPHVAAAPTASKSRVAQLQSKLIAMQADGFKVAPQRSRLGLPPLNDECSDVDLDSWAALLNEQDSNLAREVVA